MLLRLAEGIWPCKSKHINEDPKGNRYRLARKEDWSSNCRWIIVLNKNWTRGDKKSVDWKRNKTRMLSVANSIQLVQRIP